MKKKILLIIILFPFIKIFACDCNVPKPIIEFYASKYVFDGTIISKEFSKDSTHYTVTFRINRHFKKGDNPKTLSFTFQYIPEGERNSCYEEVYGNENLLVYAKYRNNKLTFNGMCSNTSVIYNGKIYYKELNILENANEFKLSNYIFNHLDGYIKITKPITNIDSILKKLNHKIYPENSRAVYVLDIDEKGNLTASNSYRGYHLVQNDIEVIDTIYGLNKFRNKEVRKPENEFESDMFEVIKKLIKWEKSYIENIKEPIKVRIYAQFYYEEKKGIYFHF